jgi:hypothetical protein
MADDRIEIPGWAREMGIFGGLVMIVLGLIIAWRRSGMDVPLPPTGGPAPAPSAPGTGDRLIEALIERVAGKPPGDGKG